jgi:hypothetical protein
MVLLNVLLFVGMIWMGAFYLQRYNDDGIAALASAGFFLMSTAFAYVFWLQPEVFNMACVALCLFLGFRPRDGADLTATDLERTTDLPASLLAMAVSGAALVPAALNKPMFLAVALPVWFTALRARQVKGLASWFLGALLSLGLLAGLSLRGTGHALAYFGAERVGAVVCEPGKMPPMAMPSDPSRRLRRRRLSQARRLRADGRHLNAVACGAGVYRGGQSSRRALRSRAPSLRRRLRCAADVVVVDLPPADDHLEGAVREHRLLPVGPAHRRAALPAVRRDWRSCFFLLQGARSPRAGCLLASLVLVGLAFLILLPFNWHGGGGFLGNRYFVSVYPAFLFLMTRVRPASVLALGFTLGGLFLGRSCSRPSAPRCPRARCRRTCATRRSPGSRSSFRSARCPGTRPRTSAA